MNARNEELKRLEGERRYRSRRSHLKKKLRRGGNVCRSDKINYNLSHYIPHKRLSTNIFIRINVPKVLCVIEDHDGTFEFLFRLKGLLSGNRPNNIDIRHDDTEKIGLTASYLFDKIIQNYLAKWKQRGIRVTLKGHISENKNVNNFLLSFGLLSGLDIIGRFKESDIDKDYRDKYEVFKMSGSSIHPHLKSEASTKLAQYFNKCLNYSNIELSPHGYGMLIDAIGEIIGNAEEHSGHNPTRWFCLGCYDKDTAQCGFSIFNYGSTIYQSLSDPSSTSTRVLQAVTDVINNSKSLLIKIKDRILSFTEEEPIWNVMALQDGISSKRTERGPDSTRGQGLMDVLQFVELLRSKGDPVKIAVISGKSKILVDYTYPIINHVVDSVSGEKRRLLPFNREGSLSKPSDPSKVSSMKHSFDGVIITGSFKINEEYLTRLLGK